MIACPALGEVRDKAWGKLVERFPGGWRVFATAAIQAVLAAGRFPVEVGEWLREGLLVVSPGDSRVVTLSKFQAGWVRWGVEVADARREWGDVRRRDPGKDECDGCGQ